MILKCMFVGALVIFSAICAINFFKEKEIFATLCFILPVILGIASISCYTTQESGVLFVRSETHDLCLVNSTEEAQPTYYLLHKGSIMDFVQMETGEGIQSKDGKITIHYVANQNPYGVSETRFIRNYNQLFWLIPISNDRTETYYTYYLPEDSIYFLSE